MGNLLGTRRASLWAYAGAVLAWCAVVLLVALIGHASTLLVVGPPAAVASIPALTAWSVVGITLLGLYFLPTAVLIAVGAVRAGKHRRADSASRPRD